MYFLNKLFLLNDTFIATLLPSVQSSEHKVGDWDGRAKKNKTNLKNRTDRGRLLYELGRRDDDGQVPKLRTEEGRQTGKIVSSVHLWNILYM